MSAPVGWMTEAAEEGFAAPLTITYLTIYRDAAGVPSERRELTIGVTDAGTVHVILFNLATAAGMDLEIYRTAAPGEFRLVGIVHDEDVGIFLDEGAEPDGRPPDCDQDVTISYESHVRWSEPYRNEWIRQDSMAAFRLGDGDPITGLASQYGNLLVFKSGSIHRATVQSAIPFSRTDEISPDIGCIAPHSLITVRNTVYFLSRAGWFSYDNNVLTPIDSPFRHSLLRRMRASRDMARRTAAWHDPATHEIGMCLPTEVVTRRGREVIVRGHCFVLSLETGAAWMKEYSAAPGDFRTPEEYRRIYHTTQDGQVFSADTAPPAGYASHVLLESPASGGSDETQNILGQIAQTPVASYLRMHDFLGGQATHTKRLRKVIAALFSAGARRISFSTAGPRINDDRVEPAAVTLTDESFASAEATGRTVLHLTPETFTDLGSLVRVNAAAGKFHRLIVEIETEGMSELFELKILWRHVATWWE